ncbi:MULTISPECIES: universal stress protein [Achromobacter]|jgi:nucleotide-binding universal stress UspA family protein|uniref:Universal stress protein n=1 Tax=Achromobacter spanius TaxID=217203 RepID=A0AAW3HYL5_9BURK|nr:MULTISPECIES: universal stress protein [Achromobacter]AZS77447.1 universal stress protein [Achromobacter spanius]KNE25376.1 universal stress protein [Achromobacter spanius]MCD0499015.1 universal stress protein [Achromobacter sp. MY14]MCW3156170.1 universal stress protein [Achromobacter spanius]
MTQQTGPILLATDLSARGDRALDRALQLARELGTQLIVLHVMESHATPARLTTPVWRRLSTDHKALAERELAEDLAAADVSTEVVVVSGDPLTHIIETADSYGCSLIVTGTARDETLGRLLLGTTVEKLVRQARQPVLVVKTRPRKPYRDVLVATDFSAGSRHALRAALQLVPNANLTLFHAYDVPFQGKATVPDDAVTRSFYKGAEQSAREFTANTPELAGLPPPKVVLEPGQPETVLSEYSFNHRSDLVVTGTHGRTGILRTAIGSVAERLLEALPSDVLIVRLQDES